MAIKGKNSGVQILRAILFIGILSFHCGLPASQILWGGIETFLVISAYFLTKSLIRQEEVPVFKRIANRIKRLYPQYLLVLLGAIMLCVVGKNIVPIKDSIIHLLAIQNFNWMVTGYKSDLNFFTAHTWTLSIEIWLFILWVISFNVLKSKKNRIIFCISMIIMAISYRIVTITSIGDAYVISLFPFAHADAFAIGSLMAIGIVNEDKKKTFYSIIGIISVILLLLCIAYTANEYNVSIVEGYGLYSSSRFYLTNVFTGNIYLIFALLSSSLLFFSFKIPDSRWTNPLVILGELSYTGYLIHWPIRFVFKHFISNVWLLFLLVLVATIIGSLIIDKTLNAILK